MTNATNYESKTMKNWQIQYENDAYPTKRFAGTKEEAESHAKKYNKYKEPFEITEAPREDQTIAKEKAVEDFLKYSY